MYSDPTLIREHAVRLSLELWEQDMVEAFAAAEGMSTQDWLRRGILEMAGRELDMDSLS